MAKKKFTSWNNLEDFMYKQGWNRILWDIEDIEMNASKRYGQKVKRDEVRERIVEWFNEKPMKVDVTSHRPSFFIANELNRKMKSLKEVV